MLVVILVGSDGYMVTDSVVRRTLIPGEIARSLGWRGGGSHPTTLLLFFFDTQRVAVILFFFFNSFFFFFFNFWLHWVFVA